MNSSLVKCRICYSVLSSPLLHYKNMPAVAQNLPSVESLGSDIGIDLIVSQCSGCGLIQLINEPVSYYREVIRAVDVSEEMKEFRIKQFSNFLDKYSLKRKKVIEIGCGHGEYLSIMRECGADVYGLEYGKNSVKECLKNGLNVSNGFIKSENYRVKNAPFDAFFMLQFLEHLPNPNMVLRGINYNIADNAVGILEVPNFDMILRDNVFSEFMRDHLFYFTKQTLKIMLELNGFEILNCEEIWHDYILSAVVRKRKITNLSFFSQCEQKLKSEINIYLSRFKKVAIWGAGHQAFAIMSLMDLSGKISYVIDSAIWKQGKYTPVTHIPIVAPDTLRANPVNAIIVMAGSYSEEVIKIIKKNFDTNIHIAILKNSKLEYKD